MGCISGEIGDCRGEDIKDVCGGGDESGLLAMEGLRITWADSILDAQKLGDTKQQHPP